MSNDFTTSLAQGVPVDQNRAKTPSVEIRGYLTSLHRWPIKEFTALRRTLGKFGSYGDWTQEQLLWLYQHGLNLPLNGQEDLELIAEAITTHDEIRATHYVSRFNKVQRVPFSMENIANTYAEQLARITGGGE